MTLFHLMSLVFISNFSHGCYAFNVLNSFELAQVQAAFNKDHKYLSYGRCLV